MSWIHNLLAKGFISSIQGKVNSFPISLHFASHSCKLCLVAYITIERKIMNFDTKSVTLGTQNHTRNKEIRDKLETCMDGITYIAKILQVPVID